MIKPPIDAITVRTAADIEALPLTTRGVACRRLPAHAFAALRRLPQLESLVISGEMDGDGLFFVHYPLPGTAAEQFEHLPRLRRVRFVAVDDVDAEALHALQALPILEELHLRQVDEVADAHVAAIAELPRLRRLWIESRGALTDRGLGRLLEALPLAELYLRGTFSPAGPITSAATSTASESTGSPRRSMRWTTATVISSATRRCRTRPIGAIACRSTCSAWATRPRQPSTI
jgi:hypothetical protein